MKHIVLALYVFSSFGCVRSTAEWVVKKTEPAKVVVDVNTTEVSEGIIFNETSEDSWYVLIAIGGLIFLTCALIPICTKIDYIKIKNYFRKKDT